MTHGVGKLHWGVTEFEYHMVRYLFTFPLDLDRLVRKHWVVCSFQTILICDSFIVTIVHKGDNSSDIYSFCDSWS